MKTFWLKSTHRSADMSYWLGEWKVGGVKQEGDVYRALCSLPGINILKIYYATEEEAAMKLVEFEVQYWIKKAGLK